MSKFLGDVRTLSADPLYMGVVFSGTLANVLRQARKAPDYGLPLANTPAGISRSRFVLLKHLNLMPKGNTLLPAQSPYSLEYAMKRWPNNFKQEQST